MRKNIMMLSDSYKHAHWAMLPPETTGTFVYFTARGGKYSVVNFTGLQYFIKEYLEGVVVTREKIDKAERQLAAHFGRSDVFNRAGWERINQKHGGRLPVRILAAPEGMNIPVGNVMFAIENLDPELSWLPGYLDALLTQVWGPLTISTNSQACRRIILEGLELTGDPAGVNFKLHDFGFRGVTSPETAGLLGFAHLIHFLGTDTLPALELADEYYGEPCAGHSIPASEHGVVLAWGREREFDCYEHILEAFPTGLVASVKDTYNLIRALEEGVGTKLRDKITNRNGTLVARPDSGRPVPAMIVKTLNALGNKFGYEKNAKGYKVLPAQIRMIQGDGIDREVISETVFDELPKAGWSLDNVAFGSGGGLLQKFDRDTQQCAAKLSWVQYRDGSTQRVYKDPITDQGKRSRPGRLSLRRGATGQLQTIDQELLVSTTPEALGMSKELLVEVFNSGSIMKDWTMAEIRQRALEA